ncbi:MAG: hypothetical protein A2Y79_01760 [Deltaproteobacteria bacterium RBG_13_43_22]|nr:MAG: hypothetical protein A2Y79_01760 [Deltaproteobacteria bacterium RBG_13_43_22]
MVTFQRTQVVGAEFLDEHTIRFNGIQEDHIYGMEISMKVRIDDGTILQIQGHMKRYTNFVCPQAISVLPKAVGLSLREAEWDKQVMREIGRKGCEHLAEIIIECGRCLDSAILSRDLARALKENPDLRQEEFLNSRKR